MQGVAVNVTGEENPGKRWTRIQRAQHFARLSCDECVVQVICLKLVRAFEKGESPKIADESGMDEFAKQLLSRAPGGVPTNFYRAAIEDTTIITMKGVRHSFPCI